MDDGEESKAGEIAGDLSAAFTEITQEAIGQVQMGDVMAGVVMFSILAIRWCHNQMNGDAAALETVIAQLVDALRHPESLQ